MNKSPKPLKCEQPCNAPKRKKRFRNACNDIVTRNANVVENFEKDRSSGLRFNFGPNC